MRISACANDRGFAVVVSYKNPGAMRAGAGIGNSI
jgi:hypothetical protein